MKRIFTDLDHRLSHVPRWPIAETNHKQSVAEHAFNVERITIRIAREWFQITEVDVLFALMEFAHHHDDPEALSGDLPTMVKPYLNEPDFERDHADLIRVDFQLPDWMRRIVKLADMLDGYWFLCVENALGNQYMSLHFNHEPGRILHWVRDNYPNNAELIFLVKAELEAMASEKSRRHSRRGR